jgi:6-phosphogluconolactonase (cycloisomerase 2 family)
MVYTETNATHNAVLAFDRAANGKLTFKASYDTGGMGGALGTPQGALALSPDGHWLVAVNAGSNDISLFAVTRWGLIRTDREAAGGMTPASVTISGNLVYVLDAGGSGNIAGFTVDRRGKLQAIDGSIQPLSGSATGPAEIKFNAKGNVLVVTERNTNLIDTYTVNRKGVASAPTTHTSNGMTPYGFDFTKTGTLVVSEAAANALSSYKVGPSMFTLKSGSVSNGGVGQAPCWVTISDNGSLAFTSDAHTGTISVYSISASGKLTLLAGTAAPAVGIPLLDLALSQGSRYLYGLDIGNGTIDEFRVSWSGALTLIGSATGIPSTASGLVAQ